MTPHLFARSKRDPSRLARATTMADMPSREGISPHSDVRALLSSWHCCRVPAYTGQRSYMRVNAQADARMRRQAFRRRHFRCLLDASAAHVKTPACHGMPDQRISAGHSQSSLMAYPSGLRDRSAKPNATGSNPVAMSTFSARNERDLLRARAAEK